MPRVARFDAPGAIQHVLLRGIERRDIFRDDRDRRDFVTRLERVLPECGAGCFAWALMPNHVHLMLETGSRALGHVMSRVATGYAVTFNRKYGRVGHLFQNRYKTLLVQDDPYFLVAVRYIHLNPVRAGLVPDTTELSAYPWTGHAALMGRRAVCFQNTARVLACFGGTRARARERLAAWMAADDDGSAEDPNAHARDDDRGADGARAEAPDASGAGAEDPNASGTRVEARDASGARAAAPVAETGLGPAARDASEVEEPPGAELDPHSASPRSFPNAARAGPQAERSAFTNALLVVAGRFGLDPAAIRGRCKERRVADARAAVCFLACRRLGVRGVVVAGELGISEPGVSRACRRGEDVVRGIGAVSWGASPSEKVKKLNM